MKSKLSNNDGERYYLKFTALTGEHPNVWEFILVIKEQETEKITRFMKVEDNALKERRRNNDELVKDLLISKLKNDFLENEKKDYIFYLENLSKLKPDASQFKK